MDILLVILFNYIRFSMLLNRYRQNLTTYQKVITIVFREKKK